MSGMAGVFRRDGRPGAREVLERMTASLRHRGGDGEGVWSSGPAGLCHVLLHTTPESRGEASPTVARSGQLVLAADARLDNRAELLAALSAAHDLAPDVPDSGLILAAYEEWGEDCARRLLGDFAFALWDAGRQALYCARDPFGVKPFYYHESDRLFAFGSEIKALLCLPEVPRRLNETRVADYLCSVLADREITFYEGVRRLPEAHHMLVTARACRRRRYWSLDPARDIRLKSDAEYAEAFRELFEDAVRKRLRSAFAVGSALSGGLDSSSITCTARRLLAGSGTPLHTFSAVFDSLPECDERGFMETVLAQGGYLPHRVPGDRLSPLKDPEALFREQDEAVYAANLFLNRALHAEARRHGVRVFLDGLEGDTVVSTGVRRLAELASRGRVVAAVREARAFAARWHRPPWRFLFTQVLVPLLPLRLRRAWRSMTGQTNEGWRLMNKTVREDFIRRIGFPERMHALHGDPLRRAKTARDEHYRSLSAGLYSFLYERLDQSAAACGLEPRYPFLDRRLVEFCLALPADQKMSGGWMRLILRRAMEGILPAEIQWRLDKGNVAPNFAVRFLEDDGERVRRVVDGHCPALAPYVDPAALRACHRRCLENPTSLDRGQLWAAVSLGLWLEHAGLQPSRGGAAPRAAA